MAKGTYVHKKIAIIGGGHMGLALAEGLAKGRKIPLSWICVADPKISKIAYLKKYNIKVTTENSFAASKADIIFIAVKPKIIKEVLKEVKKIVENKLLISVASVPTISKLKTITDKNQKIVRIMPNLPVKYNKGVIGFFEENISKTEKIALLDILSSLGTVVELEKEKDIDTIDVISACGPAITSTFIELMTQYAKKKGLGEKDALEIITEVFRGTVDYLHQSRVSPSEFIRSVATPGGITETILKNLEGDFEKTFFRAMEKGHIKTKKLNKLW